MNEKPNSTLYGNSRRLWPLRSHGRRVRVTVFSTGAEGAGADLPEGFEESRSLHEVRGVEAFGEPGVDVRQ